MNEWSDSDAAPPRDAALADIPALLDGLVAPDARRREDAYHILERVIHAGDISPDNLRSLLEPLLALLVVGLGTRESPTVFGRSFAALTLAELIDRHNQSSFLTPDDARHLLAQMVMYAELERDRRGYVPGAGWANAVGHTADVFALSAMMLSLNAVDLARILDTIALLVAPPDALPFTCGEEERLARAAVVVLHRDLVPLPSIRVWLRWMTNQVTASGAESGKEAAWLARQHNTRGFLRSFYFLTQHASVMRMTAVPPYLSSLLIHPPARADDLLADVVLAIAAVSAL